MFYTCIISIINGFDILEKLFFYDIMNNIKKRKNYKGGRCNDVNIKSNLRVLMAFNNIKNLREMGFKAGVSWKIIQRLDTNKDISKIRLGNLLKVARALNCRLSDLIRTEWDRKDYKQVLQNSQSRSSTNIRILMALNGIRTLKDIMQLTGISWSVLTKLDKGEALETIELHNILKVCVLFGCDLEELINFNYDYEIKEFKF